MRFIKMCKKCGSSLGLMIFVVGIVYLLQDINVINWFFNWWTVLFIIGGFGIFAMNKCYHCSTTECETAKPAPKTKAKKGKKKK